MAPLDLGCVLDPGPAVSCVSQGLLGFICISLVPPCAPHRTPWSSMESLRKLVSSWEHPGSDPPHLAGAGSGSTPAPWEGQQLPTVTM